MRTILSLLLLLAFVSTLHAGTHADNVKDLGDSTRLPQAQEALARAGLEAFDDLMEGLKRDPKDVNAEQAAKNSQIRLACARLLGLLADTRASAELLRLLKAEATETPAYPEFVATCAASLGAIWNIKTDAGRGEVVAELKRIAGYDKVTPLVLAGCLRGLGAMIEGAEIAAPLVKDSREPLVRSAAIGVVVACRHKPSADDLLAIWAAQRAGEATGYTKPLGLQALMGLATMGDARAVDGLVDVATLNQFTLMQALRDQAVDMLKLPALKAPALLALASIVKADDKPTQWRQAAITLGELGAEGISTLLAVADEKAPEGKEADWFKKRVDDQLTALSSESALKSFAKAYEGIAATEEKKAVREKILDQLLRYRTSLKSEGLGIFLRAANDATLEAPKRAQCINAYSEAKGKDSLADLEGWVKSEDAVLRAQAVQNLGRSYIPIAKALPLLKQALKSPGADFAKVRQNALLGLQRSDDKTLLQDFLDALDPAKEESADVRKEALLAIQSFRRAAKVKEEDIFEAIKGRTSDADAGVRAAAVGAAVGIAQRIGQKAVALEVIEKALTDNNKDVRIQAYGQVIMVSEDMKLDKLLDAALKETEVDAKSEAISALARMKDLGPLATQEARLETLVDMAVTVVETQRGRDAIARELLGKLEKEAGAYSVISRKVLAAIDRNYTDNDKKLDRVAALVPVLTQIKEDTVFDRVKKMAEEQNQELRRVCVKYLAERGTKNDIPFLRNLKDRADNVSIYLRADIEDAIRKLEGS